MTANISRPKLKLYQGSSATNPTTCISQAEMNEGFLFNRPKQPRDAGFWPPRIRV